VIESESQSNPPTDQLTIDFKIINPSINSGTEVALNTVKVRYYFNAASSPLAFTSICDSASVDNPYADIHTDVTFAVGTTPSATAAAANGTYYLEFAFPVTQSIPTADGSVTANCRFYPSNYASGTFTPTTDYSYLASDGGYVANPNMTATVSGVLVWGQTP
jgi:hypothetical protein